jgi:hypothetical protein
MKKREIELVTAMLDMQYELADINAKIEAIKLIAAAGYYVPKEIMSLFDVEPTEKTTTEKETKKEYLVDMPEGSVPY